MAAVGGGAGGGAGDGAFRADVVEVAVSDGQRPRLVRVHFNGAGVYLVRGQWVKWIINEEKGERAMQRAMIKVSERRQAAGAEAGAADDSAREVKHNVLRLLKDLDLIKRQASLAHLISTDAALQLTSQWGLSRAEALAAVCREPFDESTALAVASKVETEKALQAASLVGVAPIPPRPLEAEVPPACRESFERLARAATYAVHVHDLEDPTFAVFKHELSALQGFLVARVDLGRPTGAKSEGAAEQSRTQMLRFAGFARGVLRLPASLSAMLHGNTVALFVLFLRRRAALASAAKAAKMEGADADTAAGGGGGENAALKFLAAANMAARWLSTVDTVRATGLNNLADEIKAFGRQLADLVPAGTSANIQVMLAEGTAVPWTELVKGAFGLAQGVLQKVEAGRALNVELAHEVSDALIGQLLTSIPPQRGSALMRIQIGLDTEELDLAGNYLLRTKNPPDGKGAAWLMCFNQHKNAHRGRGSSSSTINTFMLPRQSVVHRLLDAYAGWAGKLLMEEAGGEAAGGGAFFTSTGRAHDANSWGRRVTAVLQAATGKPDLKVSPLVLRHLFAESDAPDEAAGGRGTPLRHDIAHIMGHSMETESRVYRGPPSGKALSAAAAAMVESQEKLVAEAASAQPGAAAASALPAAAAASARPAAALYDDDGADSDSSEGTGSESSQDAAAAVPGAERAPPPPPHAGELRAAVGQLRTADAVVDDADFFLSVLPHAAAAAPAEPELSKRKRGRQARGLLPGAAYLPQETVSEMSGEEKREAYEGMYGVAPKSGNVPWLDAKLTGTQARKAPRPAPGATSADMG